MAIIPENIQAAAPEPTPDAETSQQPDWKFGAAREAETFRKAKSVYADIYRERGREKAKVSIQRLQNRLVMAGRHKTPFGRRFIASLEDEHAKQKRGEETVGFLEQAGHRVEENPLFFLTLAAETIDVKRDLGTLAAARRISEGEGTDGDREIISEFKRQQVAAQSGRVVSGGVLKHRGFSAQLADLALGLPSFLQTFILTGGIGSVAKAGTKAVILGRVKKEVLDAAGNVTETKIKRGLPRRVFAEGG